MNTDHFLAKPGKFKSLKKFNTHDDFGVDSKKKAAAYMENYIKKMQGLQDRLYADNRYSVLLIFQAMDAAGKDSTIRHVMSGINPQGCQVYSFKQPSPEELDHDFLWRTTRCLPERGRIGIFNRSYYEEVLVVKVHPQILLHQGLPGITDTAQADERFWRSRYQSMNDFEKHLVQNGTQVIKFFLHVSKEVQAERFMKRIDDPDKNWKFSIGDVEERKYWDEYQAAYTEMIRETSTELAPWYVIPADRKWYMCLTVAEIIQQRLEALNLEYPKLTEQQVTDLETGKNSLQVEMGLPTISKG